MCRILYSKIIQVIGKYFVYLHIFSILDLSLVCVCTTKIKVKKIKVLELQ